MKKDFKCTKKVRDMLSVLGYDGEYNYPDVADWLRDIYDMYVMPMPKPYYRWNVWIVILGQPNTHDGMLGNVDVELSVQTIESAIRCGVEFVVKHLYDAHKKVEKYGNDEDWVENEFRACREAGFDI